MIFRPGITAVLTARPHHVGRQLHASLDSVQMQSRTPSAISVSIAPGEVSDAENRNRALAASQTEWSALLDAGDTWHSNHLAELLHRAQETGADLVYSRFVAPDGANPWPNREGQQFDAEELRRSDYISPSVLVRTDLARSAALSGGIGHAFWVRLLDEGCRFASDTLVTWSWNNLAPGHDSTKRDLR
jgi:glycosyltransferase involved in cell wall biosynthesis